ncbi:MAG: hypothetical protein LBL58_16390 [Tannerellaceae bacterium]|jgi:hypothetical protein|nr:hypothetical protein [Tannerellaceae bacterium]
MINVKYLLTLFLVVGVVSCRFLFMLQPFDYTGKENPVDIPNPDKGASIGRWQNISPNLVNEASSPFGITPKAFHAGPVDRFNRWMIYGLYLPDEVLEKIYNKNALKIMKMYKGKQQSL